jgi:hypothetical protein
MTTSAQTPQYYFISYCRQEVTFADNFSRELTKRGLPSWVDFRNLIPGQPWQPQLDAGVRDSAAILLVVSKASMASAPVKDEWIKSLAAGKRIILIIFEACPLDERLAQLEWVDFTGKFESAMKELVARLAQPPQKMASLPPQAGSRLPEEAKAFFGLSIFAAILAIAGGILTFALAYLLVNSTVLLALNAISSGMVVENNPLRSVIISGLLMSVFFLWLPAIWNFVQIPLQIQNRKHHAEHLMWTLNRLAFANLFLLLVPLTSAVTDIWVDLQGETMSTTLQAILCISVPLMLVIFGVCFALYRLLISDSMYRWAGPTGALLKAPRPDKSKYKQKEKPLRVAVESARQDRPYAEAFKASIEKAGLVYVESPQDAEVVLTLLSAYQSKSNFDPEQKTLIPVLLQKCEVDPGLSQLQWVDLRYGQDSIDAVVHLLDEPHELLRTLGVLPVRAPVLPTGVKRLVNVLSIVLPIALVFTIVSLMDGSVFGSGGFLNFLILPSLYFLRRYITERKLKNVPFLSYWLVFGIAVVLAVLSLFAAWDPALLFVPFAWLIPLLIWSKEVRMWLPAA